MVLICIKSYSNADPLQFAPYLAVMWTRVEQHVHTRSVNKVPQLRYTGQGDLLQQSGYQRVVKMQGKPLLGLAKDRWYSGVIASQR